MNKLKSILILSNIFLLLTTLPSCEEIKNLFGKDPCDDTVKPEIQVSLRAIVHVLDVDKNPIPNQQLWFYIYKEPCGADIKGRFDFHGPTNELGIRQSTVVNYNLRNSEDKVWVDVHAQNLGNGTVTKDSELFSYKYNDFIVGTTKEIHIYIYRNF